MESTLRPETEMPTVAEERKIDFDWCIRYYFAAGTCVGGLLILVGLVGNSFTLIIMGRDRKKSSTINCLFWLATADILVLVSEAFLIFPMGLRKVLDGWYAGHNYNNVTSLYVLQFMHTFNMVSTFLTVFVTWQRYISVCIPHKAKQLCTVKLVNRMTIASYIISILFYCPRYFNRKISMVDGRYELVVRPIVHDKTYILVYSKLATATFSYFLPLLSLIFMSVSILVGMSNSLMKQSKERSQARRDLTISTITIVGIFIICQTLSFSYKFLEWTHYPFVKYAGCGGSLQYYGMIPHLSVMTNSSANFFIYVIFTKGFRAKFKRLFTKKGQVSPEQPNQSAGTTTTVAEN